MSLNNHVTILVVTVTTILRPEIYKAGEVGRLQNAQRDSLVTLVMKGPTVRVEPN